MWNLSWISNLVFSCLSPLRCYTGTNADSDDEATNIGNSLLWRRDLQKHSCGEFSYAVCQANEVIEDHSQVEIGSNAIFVGVYDGHGGDDASQFIRRRIFQNLISESFRVSMSGFAFVLGIFWLRVCCYLLLYTFLLFEVSHEVQFVF